MPRIEHCSRRTEKTVWLRRPRRRAAADLTCLNRKTRSIFILAWLRSAAKIVSAIDADDFVHVHVIHQIECIDANLEPHAFLWKVKRAAEMDVPCLKAISLVRISRQISDAVRGRNQVVVGVEADEQCKWSWTLKSDDVA